MIKKLLGGVLFVMTTSYAIAQPIVTDSTSNSTSNNTNRSYNESTSTVKSPPPTAVAPSVTSINNDVCAVVASGAVQTQIFGVSMGGSIRDLNCERIKLSKNLFDMGMKVAAVATLCQDERVFTAMLAAGTPCPVDGKIGAQAKEEWDKRGVPSDFDKKYLGYYAVAPKQEKQKCEYTGDDPVVMARVCGSGW
jgi:hypothetical protein